MKNFSEAVLPHLPSLRRFARGHCPDVDAADVLVLSTLKKLRARWLWMGHSNVRLSALRLMCGLVDGQASAMPSADHSENYGQEFIGPTMALSKLAPVQRSSILLTSVERLSHREAAQVLNISEDELLRLLPQAREQLRLIVEAPLRQTLIKRPYLRRVK
ncbi:sigma factor-like helix-turn-helix DNA-binding protein [Rhizobium leguminosarum]|uniref:sigma factor-like helix-turn-helix DNA-binding protein n=1 Tax=Rhizobium leguminosarum TaxID=384 RepID=UPI00103265CF|nr:hypothetical protein ELG86_11350 [Rhizobium leguminosarum]TBH02164.1 hypothetical protein ELG70_11315 [Rhizobium leguminosarum]TBH36622.1 hypothetical protein ELG66_12645 [Rhizobium leguminosarum]TBH41826.1 hypothetical protein ELG63_10870 [Rhizobium leguminosarum]TBH66850.1 hypothetical protein ELG61_11050 [Rhizobium leguminosarum]